MSALSGHPRPPAWERVAYEAERALNSDDGRGAVLARPVMQRAMARAGAEGLADASPDPALYRLFMDACSRWAEIVDPVRRARWDGPAHALVREVQGLAAEPVRVRRMLDHERKLARAGLPQGDR